MKKQTAKTQLRVRARLRAGQVPDDDFWARFWNALVKILGTNKPFQSG